MRASNDLPVVDAPTTGCRCTAPISRPSRATSRNSPALPRRCCSQSPRRSNSAPSICSASNRKCSQASIKQSRQYNHLHRRQGKVRVREGSSSHGLNLCTILAGAGLLTNPLHVLDFGGGLGQAYALCPGVIGSRIASWRVIELPDIAAHGQRNYADDKLTFHTAIDFGKWPRPNLVIVAGVLNYLDRPLSTWVFAAVPSTHGKCAPHSAAVCSSVREAVRPRPFWADHLNRGTGEEISASAAVHR